MATTLAQQLAAMQQRNSQSRIVNSNNRINAAVPQFGANIADFGVSNPMAGLQNDYASQLQQLSQPVQANVLPTYNEGSMASLENFDATAGLPVLDVKDFGGDADFEELGGEGFDWAAGLKGFSNVAAGLGSLYGIKAGRDAIKLGRQNAADSKAFGLANLSNSAITANTGLRNSRMNFLRSQGIVGEEAKRQVDEYMKTAAVSGELPSQTRPETVNG